MSPFLFIFATIIGTVLGQLLIKAGVLSLSRIPEISQAGHVVFLLRSLTNPLIAGGLLLAFGAAVSWIFAMRALPLNFAYPFTALTIVLVIFLSTKIFNEITSPLYWIAVLFIILGLILLTFSGLRQ